jgi:hypothetical protein
MRLATFFLLLVVALWCGEWVYRGFFRPVDQPTKQMLALAQHFNALGLKGHVYPVRHNFRHSMVTAAAAFEIEGYPLPISFVQCPTIEVAESQFISVKGSPNLMHPQRNGLLVMHLPMWGDDTGAMARRVSTAFSSFQNAT